MTCTRCQQPVDEYKAHVFETTDGMVVGRYHADCCPRCDFEGAT